MLALFAVALSLAAKPVTGCRADLRLSADQLARRLDDAALSPSALRHAERACLVEAANRVLARCPSPQAPTEPPAVAAPDAALPPSLALGRSETFAALAAQLRSQCPQAVGAALVPPQPSSLIPIDQTEQGFILWLRVEPQRSAQTKRLEAYLRRRKAGDVVPIYQLLRTASDWRTCGGEPFALPPPSDWPHVIPALAWIKQRVQPAIGAVEAVSSYREPDLNQCAQGAKQSAHLDFWAVDLEPLDPLLTRAQLMQTLCATHKQYGQAAQIGLGFYAGVRFHIDAKRYRHWGFDPAAAPACAVEASAGSDQNKS